MKTLGGLGWVGLGSRSAGAGGADVGVCSRGFGLVFGRGLSALVAARRCSSLLVVARRCLEGSARWRDEGRGEEATLLLWLASSLRLRLAFTVLSSHPARDLFCSRAVAGER